MFLYVCTSARPSWLISDCLLHLCSHIYHACQPQKMNSANRTTYPGLFKYLLKCSEKVERYRHHVVFNTTYLELNVIPKGFRLKSHNNIEDCDPTSLLRKCSKKLMVKTIGCFKTKLDSALKEFSSTHNKLLQQFPEKNIEISSKLKSRINRQREILSLRRINKFQRDGLDAEKSSDVSQNLMHELIQGLKRRTAIEVKRDEVLADVVIPPYEPLNLDAKILVKHMMLDGQPCWEQSQPSPISMSTVQCRPKSQHCLPH